MAAGRRMLETHGPDGFSASTWRSNRRAALRPTLVSHTHPPTHPPSFLLQIELPYDITGLVAFELIVMHVSAGRGQPTAGAAAAGIRASSAAIACTAISPPVVLDSLPPRVQWVESRRGYDVKKPGSMDQDPIFSNFKLPAHEVRGCPHLSRKYCMGPALARGGLGVVGLASRPPSSQASSCCCARCGAHRWCRYSGRCCCLFLFLTVCCCCCCFCRCRSATPAASSRPSCPATLRS